MPASFITPEMNLLFSTLLTLPNIASNIYVDRLENQLHNYILGNLPLFSVTERVFRFCSAQNKCLLCKRSNVIFGTVS